MDDFIKDYLISNNYDDDIDISPFSEEFQIHNSLNKRSIKVWRLPIDCPLKIGEWYDVKEFERLFKSATIMDEEELRKKVNKNKYEKYEWYILLKKIANNIGISEDDLLK